MEKKTYYVSVQAGTIMERQGDAAYELEISATEEEIRRLLSLFEELSDFDEASFSRAQTLAYPYHLDSENDGYDYYLQETYRLLHELGNAETRKHIEAAGLMNLEPNNG